MRESVKIRIPIILLLLLVTNVFSKDLFTPTLVIPYINGEGISEFNKNRIKDLFVGEFSKNKDFNVIKVTKGNIASQDFNKISDPTMIASIKSAGDLITKASEQYENINFNDSIDNCKKAIKIYKDNIFVLENNYQLIRAYLYLGLNYIAKNKQKDADNAFFNIFYYDPTYKLTTALVPPVVLKRFNNLKRKKWTKKGADVQLFSKQKNIRIYIDGRLVGTLNKKLKISDLYQGNHILAARKDGFLEYYVPFKIKNKSQEFTINLLKITAENIYKVYEKQELHLGIPNFLLNFAVHENVKADLLFLADLTLVNKKYFLSGQFFEMETRKFSKSYKVELGHTLLKPAEAIAKLVAEIKTYLDNGKIRKAL